MKWILWLGFCVEFITAGVTVLQAQANVAGPYVLAFHGCDQATTNCFDPRNHRTYLAQSSDGTSWTILPGWQSFPGSVPDVIQRGNTLYIYNPGVLWRYNLETNTLDGPVNVSVSGLSAGYVDPSLILDSENRLTMFFLVGQIGSDPATCPPGQTTCVKSFRSATEVQGSNGASFTLDDGDRIAVTIQNGNPQTASDPDIFFDGSKYVLYVSAGASTLVATSTELRGGYSLVSTLPGGYLNSGTGGVPAGHFDTASQRYWTYAHTQQNGISVIRRAVHAGFTSQLSGSDWTTVVTGSSIGLTSTTRVESPSFTTLSPVGTQRFSFPDRGGISITSTGAPSGTIQSGYARIQADSGRTTPAGLAIFGFRENNVLVSEAGVSASPLIRNGRIAAEMTGTVNTGIAIANPNNTTATISFSFTSGGSGTATIEPNRQIAVFLDRPPFNGGSLPIGSFTFSSSVPVAAIALRGLTNELGEFLMTTLPVIDLSAPPATGSAVFPHFADGAGWSTQIILVNPTDSVISGTIQFLDSSGQTLSMTLDGQTGTSFPYTIPARSSQKLSTAGSREAAQSGSVRAIPVSGTATPAGLAVFSFRRDGVTVAEAGVPAIRGGTAFRLYAEASGDFNGAAVGSIQTGVAVANLSNASATITLELMRLDGSSTGLTGTFAVAANGQRATFLTQIQGLDSLRLPFQGILRISSTSPIAVTGLRGRYNERNHFLITTTPPVDESSAATNAEFVFPHFADAGGYSTQFILFSGSAGQAASGVLRFFSQSGQSLNLTVR